MSEQIAANYYESIALVGYIDGMNHLVWYQGKGYPYREVKEELQGDVIWHMISTEDLARALYDNDKGYTSPFGKWVDEQVTYYVASERDLHNPAEQILKEIYG